VSGSSISPEVSQSEYWDGIDIHDRSQFNTHHQQASYTTLHKRAHHAAGLVLSATLEQVLQGDYTEEDGAPIGFFSPAVDGMPDGTVLMEDREILRLMGVIPGIEDSKSWGSGPPIDGSSPVDYWRDNCVKTGGEGKRNNACETIVFPDGVSYSRALQWGVVVSTRHNHRALISWPLEDLAVEDGTVSVKDYETDSKSRMAHFALGKAAKYSEGSSTRHIERINSLTIVRPDEEVDYDEVYKSIGKVRKAAHYLMPGLASHNPG
jgi:hypothetical protein